LSSQRFTLHYKYFANEAALPTSLASLLVAAREATDLAYAPYSHFHVGAAFLLHEAGIIKGSNQENAAYPSGLCAERTAAFHIGVHHASDLIEVIAVIARRQDSTSFLPVSPCGACRQVLLEYESRQQRPIQMLLQLIEGSFALIPSINSLLPFAFTEDSLRKPK
jgi:cytidine deaminase